MPYNLQGEWSIWDTGESINQDLLDDGYREPPQAPPSYDFNGHNAPSSVFPTDTGHTESHTTWIPERKELRLYVVAGVMGQLVSAMDLKTELGRARSQHGQVDFISLVFRDGDYKARSNASANLRGWLSRNSFRKIDSYNGRGVLVEKDLTRKAEPQPPKIELKPDMTHLERLEQIRDQYLRDGLIQVPQRLLDEIQAEKELQEKTALIEKSREAANNSPEYLEIQRQLDEIRARNRG